VDLDPTSDCSQPRFGQCTALGPRSCIDQDAFFSPPVCTAWRTDFQCQTRGPVYDTVAETHGLVHLGCWTHCRRYFLEALQALQAAVGNPDATIAACENLITKFADTDYKGIALFMEADAYEKKNDMEKMVIFAERTLEVNPQVGSHGIAQADCFISQERAARKQKGRDHRGHDDGLQFPLYRELTKWQHKRLVSPAALGCTHDSGEAEQPGAQMQARRCGRFHVDFQLYFIAGQTEVDHPAAFAKARHIAHGQYRRAL
jgi:hypothetical protein